MKLSNNILSLENFLDAPKRTESRVDPKIQSGSQITLCPSLVGREGSLNEEERKALFERLKRTNPIARNQT